MKRLAVLVSLIVFATWAFCLPSSVQGGDAAEFSTVMLAGGVPHPSGYPWMRILGGLSVLLHGMGLEPATAAALPCALAGAMGLGLWSSALVPWLGPTRAVVGVGLLALSPLWVTHVPDAEVWGPLVLLSSVFLRAALAHRAPLWLGLALGVAVSHHLSAVLLAPLAVGAAWPRAVPGGESSGRVRDLPALLRAGALGLFGSALGLSSFATLAIASDGPWVWGDPGSLAGLLHHVSRADYGVASLSLHDGGLQPAAQLLRSARSLSATATVGVVSQSWLGLALLAVAAAGARRRPTQMRVALWRGYLGAAAACVLFPAAHNIDPSSVFGAWILERFDILTTLMLMPLWLWAWAQVAEQARGAAARMWRPFRAALLLGLVLAGTQNVVTMAPARTQAVERYALDLRATTPGPAIIFGTDDHRTFPQLYARHVLNHRTDVLYVDASLLAHGWYRDRLQALWPGLPVRPKPLAMIGALWRDPKFADVRILLANVFSRPASELLRSPWGVAWEVHRDPQHVPSPERIAERHVAALKRYAGVAPSEAPAHPWDQDLAATYLDSSRQVLEVTRRMGSTELAAQVEAAYAALLERAANAP